MKAKTILIISGEPNDEVDHQFAVPQQGDLLERADFECLRRPGQDPSSLAHRPRRSQGHRRFQRQN